MQTKEEKTRYCHFCGKEIHYQRINEDGYDWEGHKRGSSETRETDKYCECEKLALLKWKKMCLNCAYNVNNRCTNKDVIEELKNRIKEDSPFVVDMIEPEIKDVRKCCKHWELGDNDGKLTQFFE